MTEIRKLSLSIAGVKGGGILANDSVRRSFAELNDIADKTNAETIHITLGMGYSDGTLNKNSISRLLRTLRRADTQGDIVKMEISGKETDDETLKVIDFITNKVTIEVPLRRARHMNPIVISRMINEAVGKYEIIKPEISRTYRIRGGNNE